MARREVRVEEARNAPLEVEPVLLDEEPAPLVLVERREEARVPGVDAALALRGSRTGTGRSPALDCRHAPRSVRIAGVNEMDDVRNALAAIPTDDLRRLCLVTQQAPNVVPGLLAWLEHATDWELSRRSGCDVPLRPASAALDESEADGALIALGVLADVFRDNETDEISAFFTAALAALHADMPAPHSLH